MGKSVVGVGVVPFRNGRGGMLVADVKMVEMVDAGMEDPLVVDPDSPEMVKNVPGGTEVVDPVEDVKDSRVVVPVGGARDAEVFDPVEVEAPSKADPVEEARDSELVSPVTVADTSGSDPVVDVTVAELENVVIPEAPPVEDPVVAAGTPEIVKPGPGPGTMAS